MECPRCHCENREDSRFCRICGGKLPSTDETSLVDTESLEQSTREQVVGDLFAGRYRLLGQIGKGGMGVVYKAHDTKLRRDVALKFLPREFTRDTEAKERFIHEARTASGLDHPNICNIHEIDEAAGGQLFISMACYEGETVRDKLKRGPLEIAEALHIAGQVAEGLKETHRHGVVHRDIKPGNIIDKTGGGVKIMDFGLAKLAGERDLTKTGTTVGTVAYMSPEQAQGREVDHRTDIWSLGVVLYQMLTGRQPFRGEKAQAIIYSILNEDPEPVTELREGIPRELEEVVTRCLKKDADERYQSVAELSEVLSGLRRDASSQWISATHTTRAARFAGTRDLVKMVVPAGVAVVAVVLVLSLRVERVRNLLGFGVDQPLAAMKVAILPWEFVGGDREDRVLCDGLAKTASDRLAKLERFRDAFSVVPQRKVQALPRGGPVDARRELGVNVAITGAMRRSGERLTLDLVRNDIGTEIRDQVDTETLKPRSAPTISDPIANLPTWQDSLPVRLAELLELDLTPEERRLLTVGGTTVPRAYEHYLLGMGHLFPYEEERDIDAAIQSLDDAVAQDPSYASAYVGLGYAYMWKYLDTGETPWAETAVRSCESALETTSEPAVVHKALGHIQTVIGKYASAVEHFREAVAVDSLDFEVYFEMGYANDVLGQVADAEQNYREALRLRPGHIGALDHLGYLYLRQGKYADSIKLLRRLITLEPRSSKGYTHLGIAYFALDHVPDAEGMFEQALANAETTYAVCSNLGTIYYWQNRYADAARMYKTALARNDADYKVWGNLAGCYYWMPGETDKAEAHFAKAAELARAKLEAEPGDPEVLCDLASYCAVMGNRSESERLLDRIVGLGPTDPIVIFRIAETYEQLGERDLALDWIEKALKGGAPAVKVKRYPGLRDLRADPRYRQLLHDIDTT